jgi:signal transduction histidine kinase
MVDPLVHLAALERLNKMIAAFGSMVSHETRTALVGIQGYSELIREGDLTPAETREYAEDIFREAEKVNVMIGQLLDLNTLEITPSPIRTSPVDLNDVVTEVVSKLRRKLKQVAIDVELGADVAVVNGDRDRLRQAIQNVVVFATRGVKPDSRLSISTSLEGGLVYVTICCSTAPVGDFDDWLYGRYERYEQRPSAMIGAGPGLAIARTITELHGGRITVTTSPRRGSEFKIGLPAS